MSRILSSSGGGGGEVKTIFSNIQVFKTNSTCCELSTLADYFQNAFLELPSDLQHLNLDIWYLKVFLLLILLASVLIEITLPLSLFAIRWLHSVVCLAKEAWCSGVPSHLNFCVAQDKFMPLISWEWRVECCVGPSMYLCRNCLIERIFDDDMFNKDKL